MKFFPAGGEWKRSQVFHPNVYRCHRFAGANEIFNVIRQNIHLVHRDSAFHVVVALHYRPLSGSFEFFRSGDSAGGVPEIPHAATSIIITSGIVSGETILFSTHGACVRGDPFLVFNPPFLVTIKSSITMILNGFPNIQCELRRS
ncbi:hypothetical protein NBH81_18200 [Aeromonas veronii]|uniref:hypothetical protein n=1 Tax=Aeromonas veronii TaxID=654 RepID=UPI0021DB22BC|nr:hypothetical protein [Aeromonas veronii]UYB70247.1 hypothetical protein NBH81_18200 [Aeromonas veronii]